MKDQKLSLFKCLEAYMSKPVGMDEIVRLIRYDSIVEQRTADYRRMAYNVSRDKANSEVKKKLMPAFGVGVLFNNAGRQPSQVVEATGLAMCDLDHLAPTDINRLATLIRQDPHTWLCYRTISGEGLRVVYRFVRAGGVHINCEAYPAAWKKGNEHYAQLTGSDYDHACSDYGRLSGLAHDPEVYYNEHAEPFEISDQEMAAESIAATKEPGKPRKVYKAGSHHAPPEQAWPYVQRALSLRGAAYSAGHRHDYMVLAAYLFNRFGTPEDTLKQWAAQEWGDMTREEREDVISHCYKQTDDHGTWRIQQPGQGKRNSLLSTTEIRTWLSEHCQVVYNVVTDHTMVRSLGCSGESLQGKWHAIDEREEETMRCRMEADTGKRVLTRDVASVLKSDFAKLVNPVRDYLDALPEWDGSDRTAQLAHYVTVEPAIAGQTQQEAQQTLGWALHKWLVAMVATWMNDKVANHAIFTLIGPQGCYKTTFFRYLMPPALSDYFWENDHNSFNSKDDKLAIAENCIVEIEEVEAIAGRDMAELKSLVTAVTIKERRPYARFRNPKHKLASFCASGNEQQFLTDQTGNRRWLCFRVSCIEDPRQWQLDYEQLYAQLRSEYLTGFQYWFDKQEEIRIEQLCQPFRVISPEEQLIAARLRKPRGHETAKLMNSSMIAMLLTGGHLSNSLSIHKIGKVMHQLKYRIKHREDGDYFYVVEIPLAEIQSYLALGENEAEKETQESDNEQLELPF